MQCTAPGQAIIWNLVELFWHKKHNSWRPPTLGSILGCTLVIHRDGQKHPQCGANCLYRILVSESAYLIWKIRCERVIQRNDNPHKLHSVKEITAKWHDTINCRLLLDRSMTRRHFGTRALNGLTVLSTWSGTLHDERTLPKNWLHCREVLVSIAPIIFTPVSDKWSASPTLPISTG
ncbi:hypothetical protein BKA93DRAFT_744742 [Sparassis latifolia]